MDLQQTGDDRGSLVVCEINKHMPFEAKRFFHIYGTQNGIMRGIHANRNSSFFMVCVKGSCQVDVDDGREQASFYLDHPAKGLFVNSMMWKTMKNFSPDCVLLVLSDCVYDETEYIRDYDRFIKEVHSS